MTSIGLKSNGMIKYSSVSTDTTNGETHDKIKNYSRKWLTAILKSVILEKKNGKKIK